MIFGILIAVAITLVIAAVRHYRKEINKVRDSLFDFINTNDEMRKTLAMGLYYRFKKENIEATGDGQDRMRKVSRLFLLQKPLDFEQFVAEIMGNVFGGSVWVTRSSGDFGIDIEHQREEGLFLGQVKCYESDLAFEPIAIVHSQMVKQGAKGGFVVTTGSYTENARSYAQGLGIELIDGIKLVEMWADGLDKKKALLQTEIAT